MFNWLKKKTTQTPKIKMELIRVKRSKENFNCFIGKFVSIDFDEEKEIYYLSVYDNENNKYVKLTNKIDNKYFNLCNDYDYGLIYSFDEDYYNIAIICKKGYLKTYDVKLKQNYDNGTSFIIEDNNLIDKNSIVGEIKRNTKEKISLNVLDHNKLICFIEK